MQPTAPDSYRDWIVKAHHEASNDFDKAVMTLSGGALAVSITFAKNLVGKPNPGTTWWLGVGWGLFVLSLVAILISSLSSQGALMHIIRDVDCDRVDRKKPGGKLRTATLALNWLAAISFVLGAVSLSVFALANIGKVGG